MNNEQIAGIILAAGASSRMGGKKKEYQKLNNGDTVLASSVRAFAAVSSIQNIIIVIPANGESAALEALGQLYTELQSSKIIFVHGGDTRRASVFNALSFLASNEYHSKGMGYVLIHDGARPWVSPALIENIIENVKIHNAVIPVLPLVDTPKEITNGTGDKIPYIKSHLKRTCIGLAQTPQGFNFLQIFHAHEKAVKDGNEEFTDDAEIWGKFCGQVAVINGEKENRKITFKEDMD
jgi:2-C-methyl-D-erythritol 4-phosphate cytidylyltransferase/2-C-methyl-D-erythritol 4-phosphate cytidylyltransferase/2-C-methyl-D-erythritol 2,4-cyclodiphosphate synthase